MGSKVYFSVPVSVNWDTALECFDELKEYETSYWIRDERYDESLLRNCDAFVIMLPGSKWNSSIENLPIGLHRELRLAVDLRKRVYLAYKNSDGKFKFYECQIDYDTRTKGFIQGCVGTSTYIHNFLTKSKPLVKVQPLKSLKFVLAEADIESLYTTITARDTNIYEDGSNGRVHDRRLLLML